MVSSHSPLERLTAFLTVVVFVCSSCGGAAPTDPQTEFRDDECADGSGDGSQCEEHGDDGDEPPPELPEPAERTPSAAVGTLDGEFAVTPLGTARYTIPIPVAPGRAGIAPDKLALTYDSAGRRGDIARGWTLSGLSAIHLCEPNVAEDGRFGPSGPASLPLCLDGARLVRQAGADASTPYFLEGSPDIRFWRYPTGTMRMDTPDGRITWFGGTSDSEVRSGDGAFVQRWAMRRVQDHFGNYFEVRYENQPVSADDGAHLGDRVLPAEIVYTGWTNGTASLQPERRVEFVWEPRPFGQGTFAEYSFGRRLYHDRRLEAVEVYGPDDDLVRRIELDYGSPSSTTPSNPEATLPSDDFVRAVRACDGEGVCMPATRFDYEPSLPTLEEYSGGWDGFDAEFQDDNDAAVSVVAGTTNLRRIAYVVETVPSAGGENEFGEEDVFGDGNIVLWTHHLNGNMQIATIPLPDELANETDPEVNAYDRPMVMFADFNGDGEDEMLVQAAVEEGSDLYLFTPGAASTWQHVANSILAISDFDGDGAADLATCGGGRAMSVRFGQPLAPSSAPFREGILSQTVGEDAWGMPIGGLSCRGQFIDVNGDRKTDIVFPSPEELHWDWEAHDFEPPPPSGVWTLNGSNEHFFKLGETQFRAILDSAFRVADLNADGFADLIRFIPGPPMTHQNEPVEPITGCTIDDRLANASAEVYWNTGHSYVAPAGLNPPDDADGFVYGGTLARFDRADARCRAFDRMQFADLDRNGQTDVLMPNEDDVFGPVSALTYAPEADAFVVLTNVQGELPDLPAGMEVALDGFGDTGTTAFTGVSGEDQRWRIWTTRDDPQLLTRVTNGFGMRTDVAYATAPAMGADDLYPERPTRVPHRVVRSVTTPTPDDGVSRRVEYAYYDAQYDPLRRQVLGFERTSQTEFHAELPVRRTNTLYDHTHLTWIPGHPFAGRARSVTVYTHLHEANRTRISDATHQHRAGPTANGNYYTYEGLRDVRDFEVPGLCTFGSCPGEGSVPTAAAQGLTPIHATVSEVREVDAYGNVNRAEVRKYFDGQLRETESLQVTRDNVDSGQFWVPGRLRTEAVTSTVGGHTQTRSTEFVYWPASAAAIFRTTRRQTTGIADANAMVVTEERQYDNYGNVSLQRRTGTSSWGFIGQQESREFDARERLLTVRSENELGHEMHVVSDRSFGLPTTTIGPTGLMAQVRYDGFGRKTREFVDHGEGTPTNGRDIETRYLRLSTDPSPDAPSVMRTEQTVGGVWSATDLDVFAKPVMKYTTAADGQTVTELIAYDVSGQPAIVSLRRLASEPLRVWSYFYDELGRQIRSISPEGRTSTTRYEGNQVIATLPKGHVWRRTFEGERLTRTTDPAGTSVCLTYGAFGHVRSVFVGCQIGAGYAQDAPYQIDYQHDAYGLLFEVDDPNRGTAQHSYDGLGQLRRTIAPEGTISLTPDSRGRVRTRVDGDGTTTWEWDSASNDGEYTPGLLQRTVSADGVEETFDYDEFLRLEREAVSLPGASIDEYQRFSYDARGRISSRELPGVSTLTRVRQTLRYEYNNSNDSLRAVRDVNDNRILWTSLQRDAQGRTVRESYGNGVIGVRGFYSDGRPSAMTYTHGSTIVQDLRYTYDANGNPETRTSLLPSAQQRETYAHDQLDRLESSIASAGSGPPGASAVTTRYRWGTLGNLRRVERMGSSPLTKDIFYGLSQPSAPSGWADSAGLTESFTYDDEGRRENDGADQIEYTDNGQVRRVLGGDVEFNKRYASDGAVIRTEIDEDGRESARITLFDGMYQVLVRPVEAGQGPLREVYVEADGRVVARKSTEQILGRATPGNPAPIAERRNHHYLHVDALGSVEAITTASGTVSERKSFAPFGSRRDPLNWRVFGEYDDDLAVNVGFKGSDEQVGDLVEMGLRHYDPENFTFTSPDPVTIVKHTNGYNPYMYVMGSPTRLIDPTGMVPRDPFAKPWYFFPHETISPEFLESEAGGSMIEFWQNVAAIVEGTKLADGGASAAMVALVAVAPPAEDSTEELQKNCEAGMAGSCLALAHEEKIENLNQDGAKEVERSEPLWQQVYAYGTAGLIVLPFVISVCSAAGGVISAAVQSSATASTVAHGANVAGLELMGWNTGIVLAGTVAAARNGVVELTSAELAVVRGGAMGRKAALARLEGLANQVELHLSKIAAEPGSEALSHWRHEVTTFLRDMERVLPAVGKKTGTEWAERIDGWRQSLGE